MYKFAHFLQKWWIVLIVGILSIVCGIIAVINPAAGFETLSNLLMIVLIGSGLLGVLFVVLNKDFIPAWGWNLIGPLLVVIFGIMIAARVGGRESLLISLYACGMVISGINSVICASTMRRFRADGWLATLIIGLITFFLGCALFANPMIGVLALGLIVAFSMLSFGIDMILLSFYMSKINSAIEK